MAIGTVTDGGPRPNCTVVVRATPAECAVEAAGIISAALTCRPRPLLGVATGSTPQPTYAELVRSHLPMDGVRLVLLDEYVGLAPSDHRSFTSTINRHLAQPLGVPASRLLAPPNTKQRAAVRCRRFEERLQELGGVDIQILGIGRNGHIGFNEPGSPFDSRTRIVDLTTTTIRDNRGSFASEATVPRQACTQGVATILEARRLLLLVTGEHKASILRAALDGPLTPDVPASAIRLHPNTVVVADESAAATLRTRM